MVEKVIFLEVPSKDLIHAGKDFFGRDLFLEKAAYKAWLDLKETAKIDQVELFIVSGFRSYEYQQKIIDRKLANGQTLDEITKVNALPGQSEHHTGRAIDLTTTNEKEVLTEEFEKTLAFKWLTKNAHKFGFVMSFPPNNKYGFIYEPWHWCYQNEEN
ncbi:MULTISPECIES: M15 family metallopeptidase [unclassified Francisella]|uniref:M15 family metallopeptidase n=1 Tax=unclassified Francisella TaxID=2610885 RepID=UPI002E343810|nr:MULTISPECIES: M15 family metallopeptidase [unclassified Francisella]MED7818850.1 D-alanyl-D-alanine carboxypeptidase family protein [Francisella sp. 19S2-4]MED7829695.1 D-alanyl-D-alanine carboxypeptidase family protein [Francisella sp. 19S2-10]